MGFFDRFADKKRGPAPEPSASDTTGGVRSRLITARELLEARDLPGAMAIYEEVLATAGDRPDVLVTISGDLGVNGHIAEIIELIAPRYDAERHGPATGLNLLQAYLAARNPDAAQHLLDLLFALRRPDLEERLYGFSNAIAELMTMAGDTPPADASAAAAPGAPAAPAEAKIAIVTISKPIWLYGLEDLSDQILAPKAGRPRRIAFAQLAQLGVPDFAAAAARPEDDLGRLSRALPLWFAETFSFSPLYAPVAAVGLIDRHYALFATEWTTDNLRQLVETSNGELDYIFTGALRHKDGDYELLLRVWEVRKFRERKQFIARWTPATADAELGRLHEQIRLFMEWTPAGSGLPYAAPVSPTQWLGTLGTSLSLFLAEKELLPREQLALVEPTVAQAAAAAAGGEAASLAYLTLRRRAERLSLAAQLSAALAQSPLIARAQDTLRGA